MKTILVILIQLLVFSVQAQVLISGVVTTQKGKIVAGANLYLKGTYDGATSDQSGYFSFNTSEKGIQTIIISYVGCETIEKELDIGESDITELKFSLIEIVKELDEVIINSGSFEASDKKKSVILKPIDVALTAGANGDVYGAFGTLPGSHKVGEEGRLFVRGGEAYETKTFMDGMLINTPYFSKMPDLPTRGRFSPLLFNGAVFSTGGYSAEFGQALSSVVALNTTALESETKSSISVMTVGMQGSHSKRWKNTSLAYSGEIIHTGLTNKLIRQKIDWLKDPVVIGSNLMFRHKTSETGMLKNFVSFSYDESSLMLSDNAAYDFGEISLNNYNSYVNTTYNEMLNDNWMLNSGLALNFDREKTNPDQNIIITSRKNLEAKIKLTSLKNKKFTTKMGVDFMFYDYNQDITLESIYTLGFSNYHLSSFAETEIKFSPQFAFRGGLRSEYNSITKKTVLMPRLSAAVKTGKSSQFSLAFGRFTQNPEDDYQKFTSLLDHEKATHSILTYQYRKGTQTLRVEAYYKNYSDLVRFTEQFSFSSGNYSNTGSGYSKGIDVFWRDQKQMGKSDYWISYSWNDTKRNYRNYPVSATPYYISAHNLSVVYKRFLMPLNSFVSATYSYASGRPYYNPNSSRFMSDKTKSYNDLSIGLTHVLYLFNRQTVLHMIVNNILGFENIFSYNYSDKPDSRGIYIGSPVTPPSKRMAVFLISFQL